MCRAMNKNNKEALVPLIDKLERIRDECQGRKKDPEEGLDDFTKVKVRCMGALVVLLLPRASKLHDTFLFLLFFLFSFLRYG